MYDDEKGVDAAKVPSPHGEMFVGVPSMWSLPLINWPIEKGREGKAAHGDYAPVIPSKGEAVLEWMRVSKPICEENGVELMADFFMHERHVVVMNMFTWDQTDPEQKARMSKLYYGLYREAKKRGYGMYRGHVNHMGEFSSGGGCKASLTISRPHCQHERLQQPRLQPVRGEDQGELALGQLESVEHR